MPCQSKVQVAEFISVGTLPQLFNAFKTLYDMGYRGTLSTSGDPRIDMSKPDGVPVAVKVGDVIIYQTSPQQVIRCLSQAEFAAGFDVV